MSYLKILILSFASVIILFVLTKIMGRREMSQLSMFDYIVSITIGSIAAEMATSLENDFMEPLIAMIVYAIVTILISYINSKSIWARRILVGDSIILYNNGKLYKKNFKKCKLDINEFLLQCRTSGYFNLNDLEVALLEPNGKISFLPKADKRPATPEDLSINPPQDNLVTNVILDGKILNNNLKSVKHNEKWLRKKIKEQGIENIEDIFLATYDNQKDLSIYIKVDKENLKDNFE
ncbi:MAG: DUF421 domain-containing protein [Candidatus Scatovivens sp.]